MKKRLLVGVALFAFILAFAQISNAYPDYNHRDLFIDVSGGTPILSGNIWPDSSASYNSLLGLWDVTLSVSGAHRGWPDAGKSRFALLDPDSGNISSAFRLYNVDYSNLYSWSWYHFYVYIGTDPMWSAGTYDTDIDDGTYQLAWFNLKTDLQNYDIYVRGSGSSPVPISGTVWLLTSGLAGIACMRMKGKKI